MKIKVTDFVKDYENNNILENKARPGETPKEEPVTFREIFSTALNNAMPGDTPMLPEQKSKIFLITQKLYAHNEVDLADTERVLIKEQVAKIYVSPIYYGRVCELFDETEKALDKLLPSAPIDPPAPKV